MSDRQNSNRGGTASRWDVFVSWTRANDGRAWVLPLARALDAAGLRVWLDEAEIGPFDPIPEGVRDGLANAKVMLACYSHAYPTRRACREELSLALLAAEKASQGGSRVLVVNRRRTGRPGIRSIAR
jgi:TIR domain